MRRRFSVGQLLVAIVAVVLAVVAIAALTRSKPDATASNAEYTSCPGGAPDACADLVAKAVGKDAQRLPSITAPAGLTFDRGFIANHGKPPAGLFVFDTFIDGSTQPTEVTLRVSAATPEPYDPAHRGGKLRRLPSGRTYLDFSTTGRSGPFVAHVGDFEFVMSWSSTAAPKSLQTEKLALLDSLSAR